MKKILTLILLAATVPVIAMAYPSDERTSDIGLLDSKGLASSNTKYRCDVPARVIKNNSFLKDYKPSWGTLIALKDYQEKEKNFLTFVDLDGQATKFENNQGYNWNQEDYTSQAVGMATLGSYYPDRHQDKSTAWYIKLPRTFGIYSDSANCSEKYIEFVGFAGNDVYYAKEYNDQELMASEYNRYLNTMKEDAHDLCDRLNNGPAGSSSVVIVDNTTKHFRILKDPFYTFSAYGRCYLKD